MRVIEAAVGRVLTEHKAADKPLAVVLAGHNGSGKSTLWYRRLADRLRVPLINADRMMMSILPEVSLGDRLPPWAKRLRDKDSNWMRVAQDGVQAFVTHAMTNKVAFAMETVFSHWVARDDGTYESKIDLIQDMQAAGYFVVLIFVGLTSSDLSVARVQTRIALGGHAVPTAKLRSRFPKTQKAIGFASNVADATVMVDNSRELKQAFTVCRVQLKNSVVFDLRTTKRKAPVEIVRWLDVVSPLGEQAKTEE